MTQTLLEQPVYRPETQSQPPPDRGYVLVVDDEEPNRMLLRDPLEARGYEIAEAVNGQQALERVAERAPDVVLLDLMMPRMDGFEVCRRLKQNPATAPIPVLIVTALSDRKERLMGIQAGADDFLTKPVDIQEVALRVANAVRSKQLFDQLRAEQTRSEQLLLSIMPRPIADRMRNGEVNIADFHPEVSVLVAELIGLTSLSSHVAPQEIVSLLNEIFSAFDLLVEEHRLEKIKTVGDSYLVGGGITFPQPDHAESVAALALDMRRQLAEFNAQYGTSVRLGIGICTGPIIAGVIGRKRFAYDLWGETVNLASRLGSSGSHDHILVTETTYERLKDKFRFEPKPAPASEGQAAVQVYQLEGRLE